MLILSLDTTTRTGSCALARDGVVVREEGSDGSRPPASRLPGDLVALLDRARVALPQVDVFAVATGPGSFTGMRVGIATMQGLAMATGKPLIGISAFDALYACGANASRSRGEPDKARPTGSLSVATWIDAWRGEVYAALYENGREVEGPTVAHPEALLDRLAAGGHQGGPGAGPVTLFIGDGAATFQDLIRRRLGDAARIAEPAMPLLAGAVAALAADAARAGHLPPPHAIRPLYVRRPDAELAKEKR